MNINRFLNLVTDMRRAQRDYFRTRDNSVLLLAKNLERQVDDALNEIKDASPQMELFTEGEKEG